MFADDVSYAVRHTTHLGLSDDAVGLFLCDLRRVLGVSGTLSAMLQATEHKNSNAVVLSYEAIQQLTGLVSVRIASVHSLHCVLSIWYC